MPVKSPGFITDLIEEMIGLRQQMNGPGNVVKGLRSVDPV